MPKHLHGFFNNKTQSDIHARYPDYVDIESVLQSDLPFIEKGRKEGESWAQAARRIKSHVDSVCYMILYNDNLSLYMNAVAQDYPRLAPTYNTIYHEITGVVTIYPDIELYGSYTAVAKRLADRYQAYIPISHQTIVAFAGEIGKVQQLIQDGEIEKLLNLVCRAYDPLQKTHDSSQEHGKRQVYHLEYNRENKRFDFREAPRLISAVRGPELLETEEFYFSTVVHFSRL